MAENSKIEWTDHTFNPWIGCTAVSPACDNCYAESLAKRYGWAKWGNGEPRKRTSEANWKKPLAWDKMAKASGIRPRVFCASLADVFDAEVADDWRRDLFMLIAETPNLDWLLLTKRPQVAAKWFKAWPMPPNVWLGTTVEDQKMADLRIPILLSVSAKVLFLSSEPLLGPVDLRRLQIGNGIELDAMTGYHSCSMMAAVQDIPKGVLAQMPILPKPTGWLGWCIAGGESGPKARPSHPDWFRAIRDQCRAAGVSFFQKQITERGRKIPFDEWPADLKVREFPR